MESKPSSGEQRRPRVGHWTGVEIRALRVAKRMNVREFATYLGVSNRSVGVWEAGGTNATPRWFNQRSLDIALDRASAQERDRFASLLAEASRRPRVAPVPRRPREPPANIVRRTLERPDMQHALAERDMASAYRILSHHGLSQRQIAVLTEQSQSEISEILAGRRVVAYEVLARIAQGLQIPRGLMGLAYIRPEPELDRDEHGQ